MFAHANHSIAVPMLLNEYKLVLERIRNFTRNLLLKASVAKEFHGKSIMGQEYVANNSWPFSTLLHT